MTLAFTITFENRLCFVEKKAPSRGNTLLEDFGRVRFWPNLIVRFWPSFSPTFLGKIGPGPNLKKTNLKNI